MRKTLHPKFRIFDLEGLRDVGIKKHLKQKLKIQSKTKTSKGKTYPFDDPNLRNLYNP